MRHSIPSSSRTCAGQPTSPQTTAASEVEITLDDATVKAAQQKHRFADLQLALKSGRSRALADIVETLITKDAPLTPEQHSDDALGYRLLRKPADTAPKPAKMISGGIDATDTCVDSFRTLGAAMTQQILHNWSVVLHATHTEGPAPAACRRAPAAHRLARIPANHETQ